MKRAVRDAVLALLGRAGVLGRSFSAYQRLRSLPGSRRPAASSDGLPLPPARLITTVAGTPDATWFLESGRLAAESIREVLARNGAVLEQLPSLLDFGCGCGRVTRHWHRLPVAVHGSDVNDVLVRWCSENLRFARFTRNALGPPLPHDNGTFALVYALSVFTHLPEDLQRGWFSELHRVLAPDGLLVISTHGRRYAGRLRPPERERFERGELVVRWEEVAGSNLCTVFHPDGSIERLAERFEVADFVREGARGNPHQDLYLLRRR